jgi:hypothetical protein
MFIFTKGLFLFFWLFEYKVSCASIVLLIHQHVVYLLLNISLVLKLELKLIVAAWSFCACCDFYTGDDSINTDTCSSILLGVMVPIVTGS